MVAVMASAQEEVEERSVHQGCLAGFLHLFDRPQVLCSGRRLHHHAPRRLVSSSSGSATPSERSMQLDRGTPSSPDMTPPAAPRPSLQLDLKDGAAPSWRLPRLSLDSRAVVDGGGKYRPREVRAPSPAAAQASSGSGDDDDRRSPSVVARLMGLDELPGELRRSASERVPRGDSSRFRFVDPASFERSASPRPPSRLASAPDPAVGPRGGIQRRRSRFDAREVFPEPAKRFADPADGHGGEIALYGEVERRLRKRGIAKPARDLETLKQVLEALQLKGLLRHTTPLPRTTPPPPIVVMRPSHRTAPARRVRADVDVVRRPRSPEPSASPARSPTSPARLRGPQSPQRRVSPKQSPKQQRQPFWKPNTSDAAGARSRIARRAAHQNSATLFPDEEASTTTFSDGGSSGSSRWDFEPPPVLDDETSRKLERCGKLLSSIHAFTGGDAAAAVDQQPSPVSVLDAASFLTDEDSPSSSSGSKRAIDFNVVRSPRKPTATASDPEDDDRALCPWPATTLGPDARDPDYAYVAELVRLFVLHRKRDPAEVYKIAEQRVVGDDDTWHHRRLLCGAVAEALEREPCACACPWDPASWLRAGELVDHVWAEVRRAREPVSAPAADLNDVTCSAIRRDLSADGPWASTLLQQRRRPGPEVADAVLQVERLVFKDLVADTIRELADADRILPRRKLVF